MSRSPSRARVRSAGSPYFSCARLARSRMRFASRFSRETNRSKMPNSTLLFCLHQPASKRFDHREELPPLGDHPLPHAHDHLDRGPVEAEILLEPMGDPDPLHVVGGEGTLDLLEEARLPQEVVQKVLAQRQQLDDFRPAVIPT